MNGILENWKAGLGSPDTLVIDGHIHIGAWHHRETFRDVEDAVKESVAFMDANGVDACCCQGGGCLMEGVDYRPGNDFLLEVCSSIPDRLVPFMSVNPNDTRENVMAELERMYDAGVRCIKLINSYQENYPGDGPNLMALYEFASDKRMLVFNHAWSSDVILKVSEMFPDIDFMYGHYGNHQDPVLKARPNVYANIWNLGSLGWIERGVANVGAGKFTMGSDGFLNPLSVGIGPVVFARITDDEKRQILGLTMASLLDKVGVLPKTLGTRAAQVLQVKKPI